MADGYLESHYAEYEKKKAAWLRRKDSLKLKVESLKCSEHSKKNKQDNECREDTTNPA